MILAVFGVIGTLVWYALAWYGISTMKEIRDAVSDRSSNSE